MSATRDTADMLARTISRCEAAPNHNLGQGKKVISCVAFLMTENSNSTWGAAHPRRSTAPYSTHSSLILGRNLGSGSPLQYCDPVLEVFRRALVVVFCPASSTHTALVSTVPSQKIVLHFPDCTPTSKCSKCPGCLDEPLRRTRGWCAPNANTLSC